MLMFPLGCGALDGRSWLQRRLTRRTRPKHLPEYPCWVSSQKMLLVAFGTTFFGVFDIPVFWQILLAYFIFLAVGALVCRRTAYPLTSVF